jgi:type I restriction enzyme S subunit
MGEVPKHWDIKKVKHVARHTTGWTPPTGSATAYEGDNCWANIGDLGMPVITETKNHISDEAVRIAGITRSPEGSLLFSFKLSVGQVSIAGAPLYTNEAIATFLPSDSFSIGWAFYSFPAFIPENSATNIYGARLLNQQRINDAVVLVPPICEQQAIASYLDHETASIDKLLSHVQDEIKLLQELRAAAITDAVTGKIRVL